MIKGFRPKAMRRQVFLSAIERANETHFVIHFASGSRWLEIANEGKIRYFRPELIQDLLDEGLLARCAAGLVVITKTGIEFLKNLETKEHTMTKNLVTEIGEEGDGWAADSHVLTHEFMEEYQALCERFGLYLCPSYEMQPSHHDSMTVEKLTEGGKNFVSETYVVPSRLK